MPNPDESLFSTTRNGMFVQNCAETVDTMTLNPLMGGNQA